MPNLSLSLSLSLCVPPSVLYIPAAAPKVRPAAVAVAVVAVLVDRNGDDGEEREREGRFGENGTNHVGPISPSAKCHFSFLLPTLVSFKKCAFQLQRFLLRFGTFFQETACDDGARLLFLLSRPPNRLGRFITVSPSLLPSIPPCSPDGRRTSSSPLDLLVGKV